MAIYCETMILEDEMEPIDYGIDLEEMANQQAGVEYCITNFRPMKPNPVSKKTQEKIENLVKKAKKPRYDHIPRNFVGMGMGGYYIMDRKVYRGHGSERVTKIFKRVLQNSGCNDLG